MPTQLAAMMQVEGSMVTVIFGTLASILPPAEIGRRPPAGEIAVVRMH
jgi:hypothetical protein